MAYPVDVLVARNIACTMLGFGVAALLGCNRAGGEGASADETAVDAVLLAIEDTASQAPQPSDPDPGPAADPDLEVDSSSGTSHTAPASPPTASSSTIESPIGRRFARRALMVYTKPDEGTPFRGKVPRHAVFNLYAHVDGPECDGEGWGRVGPAAYVCLQHTEATEDEATILPRVLPDTQAPYYYARLRPKDASGQHPPAPRWRSYRALRRGADPLDDLAPDHDYAFVERRRRRSGAVLIDEQHRAVRERDVKPMMPSKFAGLDLTTHTVQDGHVIAWNVQWPHATVWSKPSSRAKEIGRIEYHLPLTLRDEPQRHRGETYYPQADPEGGFILATQLRRWIPMAPPLGVEGDTLWIDVELGQQVLALRQGANTLFVTLVATGSSKHPTPEGLFRIDSKVAVSDMRSRPEDLGEDAYHVEAVPWAQYFKGRYALHATFWHNRFGRRTSHGCINLSVRDARFLYEQTAPYAPPGWVITREHAVEPGTLVRIRKGTTPPEDRRAPL